MIQINSIEQIPEEWIPIIIIIGIFELILKGLALYRSARRGEKGWYIAILILNTIGLLPLFYLLFIGKKDVNQG